MNYRSYSVKECLEILSRPETKYDDVVEAMKGYHDLTIAIRLACDPWSQVHPHFDAKAIIEHHMDGLKPYENLGIKLFRFLKQFEDMIQTHEPSKVCTYERFFKRCETLDKDDIEVVKDLFSGQLLTKWNLERFLKDLQSEFGFHKVEFPTVEAYVPSKYTYGSFKLNRGKIFAFERRNQLSLPIDLKTNEYVKISNRDSIPDVQGIVYGTLNRQGGFEYLVTTQAGRVVHCNETSEFFNDNPTPTHFNEGSHIIVDNGALLCLMKETFTDMIVTGVNRAVDFFGVPTVQFSLESSLDSPHDLKVNALVYGRPFEELEGCIGTTVNIEATKTGEHAKVIFD